ncbi:MAG: hypothetical protein H7A36_06295 [Chlamydiales bacterium]|nr:hypothetical protein [Chlamydiales bacterium]
MQCGNCCGAQQPGQIVAGIASVVVAVALVVLTAFVAKQAIGTAQVGLGGTLTLSLIALAMASVGGALLAHGAQNAPKVVEE